MTDQTPDLTALTTVEVTVSRELPAGGEVTVEVRVTAPVAHLHAAYALNAAAAAADTGLRATDPSHPAHRQPDQCGRTFVHLPHDTTMGWCAGLDGTEGVAAQPSLLNEDDAEEAPIPPTIIRMSADEFRDLVSGLQVIRAGDAADERDGWPTVDPDVLERVLEADANQPGVYGTAVRDVLIQLGLVRPNAFHGRRARR